MCDFVWIFFFFNTVYHFLDKAISISLQVLLIGAIKKNIVTTLKTIWVVVDLEI